MTAIVEPVLDEAELAEFEAELPTEPEIRPMWEQVVLYLFVLGPFAALIAVIVCGAAFGFAPSLVDCILASIFYAITGYGVTVGLHRYFTHGSFKANRGLKIGLGIAGSMAVQGPVIRWVADHRKHHANSDKEGDPHSPWRYGTGAAALAKGFWHAHLGWLIERDRTNAARSAPDLLADRHVARVVLLFPLCTAAGLLAPAVIGGLATMSWWGALTAFFWAGLVRVAVLHHVTWSINSICHMVGDRPWQAQGRATNVWPLAILSMGESWHNLHHADPTCARHGIGRGQIDMSARVIWAFEKLGWAHAVRWPTTARRARLVARGAQVG